MNRHFQITLIACALLGSTVVCQQSQRFDGIVLFAAGPAHAMRAGKKLKLIVGSQLKKGDVLSTGPQSKLTVQLGRIALARLGAETTVTLTELLPKSTARLELTRGNLLNKIAKTRGKPYNYSVQTPTAVASVRGTTFRVALFENRTRIAVGSGRVNAAMFDKSVDLSKGQGVEIEVTATGKRRVQRRPLSAEERLDLERISNIRIASNPARRLQELKQALANAEKMSDQKIKDLTKPLPLPELKKKYGRIDRLTLADGREVEGVLVKSGKTYVILTPWGVIRVPKSRIRKHTIAR